MAGEGSGRRARVVDLGWVVLLLGAALAFRQRSAFFQVPAFAVLVLFLGWQTFAKLTHRRTPFDTGHGHVGFCLTAAVMVFGGGSQLVHPQPDTAGAVRALGGFIALAGVVMIAAEGWDFRSWQDRMAQEGRSWWW